MTRLLTLCLAACAIVGLTAAQAPAPRPDPRTVRLRGDRFRPLTYDEMTPAQRTMIEHVLSALDFKAFKPHDCASLMSR